jgi:hypothetical protein
MDSLFSFPVGLFHPLQHAGLSRRSPIGRQSWNRQSVLAAPFCWRLSVETLDQANPVNVLGGFAHGPDCDLRQHALRVPPYSFR